MAANTMPALALNRVYSTTLHNQRSDVAMEIVQSNPLLWHFYRQGAVRYEGGTEVRTPVVVTESQNVSAIAPYDTFSTTPEDGPDTARYPNWYKNRCSVVLDNTEIAQNKGPQQIVNLLESKLAIAKISLINDLSRQIWIDNSANTNEIDGIYSSNNTDGFIQARTEATQANTTGGIDRAVYANWRNRYQSITAFGADGLDAWEQCYMDCSSRGSHPDLIVTSPTVYRFYKRLVAANQEERDKALWDQGFQNLLFEGTPVVPDPELDGTGRTFFLTTTGKRQVNDFNLKPEYFSVPGKNPMAKGKATGVGLQLAILTSDDFRTTDFMTPPNSDVIISHTYLTCMLTASSLGRQGLVDFNAGAGTVQF